MIEIRPACASLLLAVLCCLGKCARAGRGAAGGPAETSTGARCSKMRRRPCTCVHSHVRGSRPALESLESHSSAGGGSQGLQIPECLLLSGGQAVVASVLHGMEKGCPPPRSHPTPQTLIKPRWLCPFLYLRCRQHGSSAPVQGKCWEQQWAAMGRRSETASVNQPLQPPGVLLQAFATPRVSQMLPQTLPWCTTGRQPVKELCAGRFQGLSEAEGSTAVRADSA